MPEGAEEALGGEHVGVGAGVDLGRGPIEFVDGGVVGWEGFDAGAIGGDVGSGGGFEGEGKVVGEDVADDGDAAAFDGGDGGGGDGVGLDVGEVEGGYDLWIV